MVGGLIVTGVRGSARGERLLSRRENGWSRTREVLPMTEADWNVARHPYDMIYHKGCRSVRKRRLLSSACVRSVFGFLSDERFVKALDVCERYADGLATEAELRDARRWVRQASEEMSKRGAKEPERKAAASVGAALAKEFMNFKMAIEAAQHACGAQSRPNWDAGSDRQKEYQCVLTRDIFVNPFRPVTLISSWLTPTVTRLGETIYAERTFDLLPILADALEDAGCSDADILNHCRQPGEHVRGCWVVDLLLGKS